MRTSLTEEQVLVRDSALAWAADHYDFRQRAAGLYRDGGAPAVWTAFAELGWLGLAIPEQAGGLGMGPIEAGLLMQVFGRHLVVEPWHECVLQGGRLLALVGTRAQQQAWLPGLMAGEARLALAHAEPFAALPWSVPQTLARRRAGGWVLEGRKRQVVSGPGADRWIVSARVEGSERVVLLWVDPASAGVTIDAYDTVTGARAADAAFDGVQLDASALLGAGADAGDASALLHQVLAESLVAKAWEAAGAMQAALEQTVEYTRQRRQFGMRLAEFQVVQHRLAEMAVQRAEAQAACELAALTLASGAADAIDTAAFVKTKVGRAARVVANESVQLFGAMGVCEELPIAATFRLLTAFDAQGGSAAAHAARRGASLLGSGGHAVSRTLFEPQDIPA